jgi:hypothetical protein
MDLFHAHPVKNDKTEPVIMHSLHEMHKINLRKCDRIFACLFTFYHMFHLSYY